MELAIFIERVGALCFGMGLCIGFLIGCIYESYRREVPKIEALDFGDA